MIGAILLILTIDVLTYGFYVYKDKDISKIIKSKELEYNFADESTLITTASIYDSVEDLWYISKSNTLLSEYYINYIVTEKPKKQILRFSPLHYYIEAQYAKQKKQKDIEDFEI